MKKNHKQIMYGALGICCLAALGLTLSMVDCSKEGRGKDDFGVVTNPDLEPSPQPPADILTAITDPAFMEYVDTYLQYWDTDGNGELSYEETSKITDIEITNGSVTSMAGIEWFPNIKSVFLSGNNGLTELDLSQNTKLTYVNCDFCSLVSLDVSGSPDLQELSCMANRIVELDLSNNTALETLNCNENQLTSLDLSANTALKTLDCGVNQLTYLNVSQCTALKHMICYFNQLPSLDISKNTALTGCELDTNPGDGTTFAVKAWFDNSSIPAGFTTGSWQMDSNTITVNYQKAN